MLLYVRLWYTQSVVKHKGEYGDDQGVQKHVGEHTNAHRGENERGVASPP